MHYNSATIQGTMKTFFHSDVQEIQTIKYVDANFIHFLTILFQYN